MWSSLVIFSFFDVVYSLCGSSIRWSHNVHMEDVYGMWYGVGYAQHSLDMSDRPLEIGCVTLYITDATVANNEWLDWSFPRRYYTDHNWKLHKSNPWLDTVMSSQDPDIHVQRRFKRDYEERRVKVVWDEDGQSMERAYLYSVEDPGLWTAEKQWRPMEKVMKQKGVDIWYPDEPPFHPDVVRVLKVTPVMLIINRCSEVGASGVVSLVLRRSPEKMEKSEWYEIHREFYNFELPSVQRYATVCAASIEKSVLVYVIFTVLLSRYLY